MEYVQIHIRRASPDPLNSPTTPGILPYGWSTGTAPELKTMPLNIPSPVLKSSPSLLPKGWARSAWAETKAARKPKALSFTFPRVLLITCETPLSVTTQLPRWHIHSCLSDPVLCLFSWIYPPQSPVSDRPETCWYPDTFVYLKYVKGLKQCLHIEEYCNISNLHHSFMTLVSSPFYKSKS